jgi:hypothetical protein
MSGRGRPVFYFAENRPPVPLPNDSASWGCQSLPLGAMNWIIGTLLVLFSVAGGSWVWW